MERKKIFLLFYLVFVASNKVYSQVSLDVASPFVAENGTDYPINCMVLEDTDVVWLRSPSQLVCTTNCSNGQTGYNETAFSQVTVLGNTSLISIPVNSFEDGGEYVCVAANDTSVDLAILQVYVQPYFVTRPVDTIVPYAGDQFITCAGEGFPNDIEVEIKKNGEDTAIPLYLGTMFHIQEADPSQHDGTYTCTIRSTSIPELNTTTTFTVTVEPVSPEGSVNISGSIYVEHGEEVNYTCAATGGPNVVTWIFNGVTLLNDGMSIEIDTVIDGLQTTSNLRIRSIDAAAHQGSLTCQVRNSVMESGEASLIVTASPVGIVSTPMLTIAARGDNVTLTCDTAAGPDNVYIWFYNITAMVCTESNCSSAVGGFDISNQELNASVVAMTQTLNLYNLSPTENGGQYVCVVINDAGVELSSSYIHFPPQIINHPSDTIPTNTNTASFWCEAEGFPAPQYKWQSQNFLGSFTDVSNITDDSTFTIASVEYSDAGQYRCVASNTINETLREAESDPAVLNVSPSGSVEINGISNGQESSTALHTATGGQFTIACNARGGPNNNHIWTRDGEPVQEDEYLTISNTVGVTESESILMVTNVNATIHKGTYTCTVRNGASLTPPYDSQSITIIVSPVNITSLSPSISIKDVGNTTVFSCDTEAGPMNTFLWLFKANNLVCTQSSNCTIENLDTITDEQIMNITVGNTSTLMIDDIRAVNGGDYTCVVMNDAGIELVTSYLYVRPYFTESPFLSQSTVAYFDPVELTCSAEGFPGVSIQWLKDEPGSMNFIAIPGETTTQLIFTNAVLENSGGYQCRATNTINGMNEITFSSTAGVTVNPISPTVSVSGEIHLTAGQEVTYNCTIDGAPDNTVEWIKDGVRIVHGGSFSITTVHYDTSSFSQLVITSVEASTHQGMYSCNATNVGGNDIQSFLVTVSPEGILTTVPNNITALRGDSVDFDCITEAGPNTTIIWFHNINDMICTHQSNCTAGQFDLSNEALNNLTVGFSSELNLPGANAPDNGGDYTCVALNDAGIEFSTSTLYFTPEFTEQPADMEVDSIHDPGQLTLRCRAEAYPEPSYQWQKRESGQFVNLPGETQSDLHVGDIAHSHAGLYRCVVSNVINKSPNTIVSRIAIVHVSPNNTVMFTVETSGEFEDSNIYVEQEGEFSISCIASGGPNNTHIWKRGDGTDITDGSDGYTISHSINDTVSASILRVSSVDASTHKGDYICEVINEAGDHFGRLTVYVSPSGIVSTVPQVVVRQRGDNMTFSCSSDAGPMSHFMWFHRISDVVCNGSSNCSYSVTDSVVNQTLISQDRDLVINGITAPSDGGEYTCIVLNEAGIGMNTSILNVELMFVTHPQSVNVTIRSDSLNLVDLSCVAESFPYPTIQWQKMNKTTGDFEDIPGETDNILTFDPIDYDDFGMYRCRANHEIDGVGNEVLSDTALVAVSPVDSVDLSPENKTFSFEDQVILTCTAEGGPHNEFQWMHSGAPVFNGSHDYIIMHSSFESNLIISSLDGPVHHGLYTCIVSNQAGEDSKVSELFVNPYIIEQPLPVLLHRTGDNSSLTCRAEAHPSPSYTWVNILSDAPTAPMPHGVLDFNPIVFGDEGQYQCIVTNTAPDSVSVSSNISTVYVSPLGGVRITPDVINGEYGDNHSTLCQSMGGLYNTFRWTYVRTNETLTTDPELNLEYISAEDGGMYQCLVTNRAGTESELFTLNVAPMILEDPVDTNVTINIENIVLNCTVSGYPHPIVTWYHNDTEVDASSNRHQVTSHRYNDNDEYYGTVYSELVIYNASVNDTGEYYCQASSIDVYNETDSDTVLVLVQDVPEVPLSVDASDVFSRNLTLSWIIPHDNNAPILGYYIFYNQPSFIDEGSPVVITLNENTDELIIEGLHPGQYYNFTVIAFNEEGNSTVSEYHQVRTLEEAPDGAPQSVRGSPISSREISVKWDHILPINRLGVVVSYDVMYSAVEVVDSEVMMNIKEQQVSLTGLNEFTTYNISVRGRTLEGPGPFSEPVIMVLTNETLPARIETPPAVEMQPQVTFRVTLSWSPPANIRGIIISYLLVIETLGFFENVFTQTKRKRQDDTDPLMRCLDFTGRTSMLNMNVVGTSANVSLASFGNYRSRVAATTSIGTGNFSDYTYFTTPEDVRGVVTNLTGTIISATSVLLQWESPPCPNGPITGYHIYYRKANYTQSDNIDSSEYNRVTKNSSSLFVTMLMTGLDKYETYVFHVRAFGVESEPGEVDQEIKVTVDNRISLDDVDVPVTLGAISAGSQDLTVGLPSTEALASIGITNIQFYGVVVIPKPDPNFMIGEDDFDATYPNLQPYGNRGDNRYYIGAGWNNLSIIPASFKAGDGSTTVANRSGVQETYLNKKLNRNTDYCFYIVIHHRSEVGNEIVVRYAELSCQSTERGYHLVGLVVAMILLFLLLLLILILVVCLLWFKCRNRNDKYYVRSKDSTIKKEKQTGLLIFNPAFTNAKTTEISTIEFPSYVEYMHSNNDMKFSDQFVAIEPFYSATTSASDANKDKIRYKKIAAYDESRVILRDPSLSSDYINASHIKPHKSSRAFIVTQGPLSNTVEDFWTMVWEQNISKIVMLTSLEENDNNKCAQYWPNLADSANEYSSLKISLEAEEDKGFYVVCHLTISKNNGEEIRKIEHLQLTVWKENMIPKKMQILLDFVQAVQGGKSNPPPEGPTLVHCSIGAGRTGIFIAVLGQIERANYEGVIDVHDYTQYLLKQHPSVILNEAHYIFIHDTLVEAIRVGMIDETIAKGNSLRPHEVDQFENGENDYASIN